MVPSSWFSESRNIPELSTFIITPVVHQHLPVAPRHKKLFAIWPSKIGTASSQRSPSSSSGCPQGNGCPRTHALTFGSAWPFTITYSGGLVALGFDHPNNSGLQPKFPFLKYSQNCALKFSWFLGMSLLIGCQRFPLRSQWSRFRILLPRGSLMIHGLLQFAWHSRGRTRPCSRRAKTYAADGRR